MGVCVEWLKGLQYAPQRLRNLSDINKILAHRPWLLTKEHIQVGSVSQTHTHSQILKKFRLSLWGPKQCPHNVKLQVFVTLWGHLYRRAHVLTFTHLLALRGIIMNPEVS